MQIRAALSTIHAHRYSAKKAASVAYRRHFVPGKNLCNVASNGDSSCIRNLENAPESEEKHDMPTTDGQYDIAIIGGGMVGLALACALSSRPLTRQLSLAIIDSNPALQLKDHLKKVDADCLKDDIPDPRVSTVTPATISFFKEIGAWKYVQQQRHAFFDQMQVWDYTGLGYTRYNARDVGKECLGCVVENKVLSSSLLSCLQNADFQKTIYSSRLSSMTIGKTQHDRLVKLEMSDGKALAAKLVVGADGAKSRVREISGVKTTGWNYSQSAVICTVEHQVGNYCAWQRFLPSGPIAVLPVGDKFSNIVWTMSPEGSSDHKLMSEKDFVKAVNHALDYGSHPESSILEKYIGRLSSAEDFQVPPKVINVVSERRAFPLSLMHAHAYVLERVALIGDAAHTVHPLAGQGVNLGFGDAMVLSKVISDGLLVGADIGELSLLKKYEKERKAANVTMMAILDGFQKAYSVDFGPFNLIRAAAFHGAQYIPPLKRNIISFAMGEHGFPLFSMYNSGF